MQTAQVCGYNAGIQSNWLITQLINRTVNGSHLPQVSVLMEFEQQGCNVTLICQRTFNTHIFETSSVNPAAARDIAHYHQVRRVSQNETSGVKVNETVHINLNTSNSSFYFAIQDETSCTLLSRMLVFYSVCPKQTSNLIHYPENLASIAPIDNQLGGLHIKVEASCVDNATTENGQSSFVVCSPGGMWTISAKGCQCIPGHSVNSVGTCSRKLRS